MPTTKTGKNSSPAPKPSHARRSRISDILLTALLLFFAWLCLGTYWGIVDDLSGIDASIFHENGNRTLVLDFKALTTKPYMVSSTEVPPVEFEIVDDLVRVPVPDGESPQTLWFWMSFRGTLLKPTHANVSVVCDEGKASIQDVQSFVLIPFRF